MTEEPATPSPSKANVKDPPKKVQSWTINISIGVLAFSGCNFRVKIEFAPNKRKGNPDD